MGRDWDLLTVTPNAAIDILLEVSNFTVGRICRAGGTNTGPGGKGLNVARFARAIDHPVCAAGFLGGWTGKRILEETKRRGIDAEFVVIPGESRTCITVVDVTSGVETEIRESGPTVTSSDCEELVNRIMGLAKHAKWIACCGSLPPMAQSDLFGRIVAAGHTAGCKTILDSSGPALASGVLAGPTIVKSNQHEFEELIGAELPRAVVLAEPTNRNEHLRSGLRWFHEACKGLFEHGVKLVVVSLGGYGSLAAQQDALVRVWAPRVRVESTVSCGDAMVAGLACGDYDGVKRNLGRLLRQSTALASAAAMEAAPGCVIAENIAPLFQKTRSFSIQTEDLGKPIYKEGE